ncbi:hypothetical protein [Alsobacter sp. R-9]
MIIYLLSLFRKDAASRARSALSRLAEIDMRYERRMLRIAPGPMRNRVSPLRLIEHTHMRERLRFEFDDGK